MIFIGLNATAKSIFPTVKIDTLIDFTKEDSAALFTEIKILESKILGNKGFWDKIIAAEFYCRQMRIFHCRRKRKSIYRKIKKDKHEYTNKEIHDLLFYGMDEIGGINDGVLNFKLKAVDKEKNRNGSMTHGSTNSGSLIISSNRKTRIHSKIKGKYAVHLLHEYMHVLGFKHKNNSPSKNKKKCGGIDIPLKVQQIAESCL
jgi:hypothetical protein